MICPLPWRKELGFEFSTMFWLTWCVVDRCQMAARSGSGMNLVNLFWDGNQRPMRIQKCLLMLIGAVASLLFVLYVFWPSISAARRVTAADQLKGGPALHSRGGFIVRPFKLQRDVTHVSTCVLLNISWTFLRVLQYWKRRVGQDLVLAALVHANKRIWAVQPATIVRNIRPLYCECFVLQIKKYSYDKIIME